MKYNRCEESNNVVARGFAAATTKRYNCFAPLSLFIILKEDFDLLYCPSSITL
jgi:hypothetical protein